MDYSYDYIRYTKTKERTDYRFVRPGQVIRFLYNKEFRIGLVLNPDFNGKLHLIKLNEISFNTFQRLIRPHIPAVGDVADKGVAAQLLYRELKPRIDHLDCYRVYSARNIKDIEILDLIKTTITEEIVEEKQEAIAEGRAQFEKEDLTKEEQ